MPPMTPSPDLPDAPDVSERVGPDPISIDAIAARLGLSSIREIRGLSRRLEDAARAGRVRSLGKGMWTAGDGRTVRDPATVGDVAIAGFVQGADTVAFAQIRDRVAEATGRDVLRLHETVASMVNDGLLEPRRNNAYALTAAGMALRIPDGLDPDHRRAIRMISDFGPMSCGHVSLLIDRAVSTAGRVLTDLLGAGLVTRSLDADGIHQYAIVQTGLQAVGPAERRALAAMTRPVTPGDISGTLGVSKERARQLARKLVERGLAACSPPGDGVRSARYVARPRLAAP